MTRNERIEVLMPVLRSQVRKARRKWPFVEYGDHFGAGSVGMLETVDRHPDLDAASLRAVARKRIYGEIINAVQRHGRRLSMSQRALQVLAGLHEDHAEYPKSARDFKKRFGGIHQIPLQKVTDDGEGVYSDSPERIAYIKEAVLKSRSKLTGDHRVVFDHVLRGHRVGTAPVENNRPCLLLAEILYKLDPTTPIPRHWSMAKVRRVENER